ncbi:MAG TPA: hypothetical protein VD947_01810 [Patescibacteria group bacterium]|nr:hypothetical protein [Patescibacteria group bacterium]
MQTLIIHGRQTALGQAELESLYGSEDLRPIGRIATVLDIAPAEINFTRLGGMVKLCKILTVLDTIKWDGIEKFLLQTTPSHAKKLEEGKLTVGLSTYDMAVSTKRMLATGLELKKAIKNTGRSVRLVPNKDTDLNAAQVLYNKLTQEMGWELVFVRNGGQTIVAQTIAVQDIDKYAARDQARPYRDARVGMLPPKLAQTIINLAVGRTMTVNSTVQDPFCGTGVILQEAMLMGYTAKGGDLDPRMVEYTQKNIAWLQENFRPEGKFAGCEPEDATTAALDGNTIACETYLGRALSSLPDPQNLQKIINDCDTIHSKFLKNIAAQTKSGFRMCIAVPAWSTQKKFRHLPTLDKLTDLGYNRVKFVHVSNEDLIYHRPNQIVARELVVLERN